jgi:hypothetical protein
MGVESGQLAFGIRVGSRLQIASETSQDQIVSGIGWGQIMYRTGAEARLHLGYIWGLIAFD